MAEVPNSDDQPLAPASAPFRHSQLPELVSLLQHHAVVFVTHEKTGVGATTLIKHAAEQLVQSTQLVHVRVAATAVGWHPSVEHAYRNGGIVACLGHSEAFFLASAVLNNEAIIGLQHPERPLTPHPDFRLIIETQPRHLHKVVCATGNLSLGAHSLDVQPDTLLWSSLSTALFKTKKAQHAFDTVLSQIDPAIRYNLHLLDVLSTAASIGTSLRRVLSVYKPEALELGDVSVALHVLGEDGSTAPRRSNGTKAAQIAEQATPEEKQAHLRSLVEQPTIVADPTLLVPAAPEPPADELPDGFDADLGF